MAELMDRFTAVPTRSVRGDADRVFSCGVGVGVGFGLSGTGTLEVAGVCKDLVFS